MEAQLIIYTQLYLFNNLVALVLHSHTKTSSLCNQKHITSDVCFQMGQISISMFSSLFILTVSFDKKEEVPFWKTVITNSKKVNQALT